MTYVGSYIVEARKGRYAVVRRSTGETVCYFERPGEAVNFAIRESAKVVRG
jgi:hypothetical protein